MSAPAYYQPAERSECGSHTLNLPWYLIKAKPCQEERARHFISLMGAEVFLPVSQPSKSVPRPFFPGYLFGSFPLELFTKVNNAFGVRKIVRFGGTPAIVPESIISDLREMKLGERAALPRRFQHGDRVAVVGGPLRGWYGVFDSEISGKDRVRILLDTLSFTRGFHQHGHGAALSLEVGKFDLMLA